jgi:beta-glucosidase
MFQSKYSRGGLVVRAPNSDLARDPRWGRTEESYGEDPFFNGTMTVAFVKGLQGDDPKYWMTASLMKHFLANSNEDGRGSSSSNFDERLFREYYSVPFRMGITEGGSRAFMASYNSVNGTPMEVNPILKKIAVGEWGNDGIMCTDGGAMTNLVTEHKRYATLAEASAESVKAGTNQFLDKHVEPTREAIQKGLLTESEIDQSLRGVFRVMIRLGMLDPAAMVPYNKIGSGEEPWTTDKHKALARLATQKSIVLLKNDKDTLPLDKNKLKSIAVIGPYANQVLLDWYSGTPPYTVSAVDGVRNKVGDKVRVAYAPDNKGGAAERLARSSDIAIVVVGNHPECDAGWAQCPLPSDGKEAVDRKSLTLEQEELVKQVYAANPRTIVVLIASFPYAINWTKDHIPAIVQMTHNSEELGNGLADVLFGDVNPGGRLVHTWPKSLDDLPPMMDYDIRHGRTYMYFKGEPLFAFGYGLSYTSFEYSNLRLSSKQIKRGDPVTVKFEIKNTGKRAGDEVAQLYASYPNSKVERPKLQLRGFQRVTLAPGEKKTVEITVKPDGFAYWNAENHRFEVEPGPVKLMVGSSSALIRFSDTLTVGE